MGARREYAEMMAGGCTDGGCCAFANKHSTQKNAKLINALKNIAWGENSEAFVKFMCLQSFARHHQVARTSFFTYRHEFSFPKY